MSTHSFPVSPDCCCGTPPACGCALFIPPVNDHDASSYEDYATAAARIAAQVANCIGYVRLSPLGGLLTSFVADDSVPDQLTMTVVGNPDNAPDCQAFLWCSLSLKAGSTLTVTPSAGGGLQGAISTLYTCDGTYVDEQTGSPQVFTIATDGEYLLNCSVTSVVDGFGGGSDTLAVVITSDDTMVINPVIALWDDSGTTRQLEACPVANIPDIFGEGEWYADQTAAQAAIDNQTSNCVGFCAVFDSFTATDGGTSLTFAGDLGGEGLVCWGSISLLAAGTITFTFSNSLGGFAIVYAADGATVVAGPFSGPGPHTTGTLPPGKYYVNTNQSTDLSNPAGSVVITASVSMTVGRIQALYDRGLGCPARLDCVS